MDGRQSQGQSQGQDHEPGTGSAAPMQAAVGMRGRSSRCRWSCGWSAGTRRPGPMRWRGRRSAVLEFLSDPRVTGVTGGRGVGGGERGPGRTRGSGRWCGGLGGPPGSGPARCRGSPSCTGRPRSGCTRRCRWTTGPPTWPGCRFPVPTSRTRRRREPRRAGVPVLWLNPELPMSAGKAMAQVGHGVQLAWWELEPTDRSEWKEVEFDLRGPDGRQSGSGRNCSRAGCRW